MKVLFVRYSGTFLTILVSFLFVPSFLLAQSVPAATIISPLTAADVSVDLSDNNPGPNEAVSVNIQSYAFDLDAALTTWYVNGKKIASGHGIKQETITTGAIGQKTTIDITISTPTGDIDKSFSLIPATVDLTWEALTYTPPFFKGKALFTYQASVKFIAFPHVFRNGTEIAPGNLIYTWSNNDTVLGDQSGYGKNTLTIAGAFIPRPMNIDVKATDPTSGSTAEGVVSLAPQAPLVLFYKNDPLYGVQYEKALGGNYPLSGREIEIAAVPYYFSTASVFDNTLAYTWEINGNDIGDGQNSSDKVFRAVGDTFGTSNISLSVSHSSRILQTADNNFSITFAKPTTQTVF